MALMDLAPVWDQLAGSIEALPQSGLLLAGGWTPARRWTDSQERFSLILAEWTVPRGAP